MNYRVPKGTIEAAQSLLANPAMRIRQVHQITLRDADDNEDQPKLVTFVPIGNIIGIAVHPHGTVPADADFVFVSAEAFGNMLPALGFTAGLRHVPSLELVAPK